MPRLLQALAGAPEGGAERHFLRLAVALQRAGVAQRIIMRPHPAGLEVLRGAGIEPVTAPFGGPLDRKTKKIFRQEIDAFRPQIALTYMNRASNLCPKGDFLHIGRLGGYYDIKYYRSCDHLVCITPDLADHCVRSGWPSQGVDVIPNFVEDLSAPPQDRAALNTPAEAPLIFALGRLHENKAFDILLEALTGLPQAYLWLAGEGPERGNLERLAARLGVAERVRFLGWQNEPSAYFAAADVYVVPSRHEPLGSVVLEGWMYRVPMVAAASQGPQWLIREGETGLLVPVDDAPALAAAVQRLFQDRGLADRLVAAGRATFEANHTEAVAVRRYLDLFDRLLNQGDRQSA